MIKIVFLFLAMGVVGCTSALRPDSISAHFFFTTGESEGASFPLMQASSSFVPETRHHSSDNESYTFGLSATWDIDPIPENKLDFHNRYGHPYHGYDQISP